MPEVAIAAESAPPVADTPNGKGESGKMITSTGNPVVVVNQTGDTSSSGVLQFLQSIPLPGKVAAALTFVATQITSQMVQLADQVVSLYNELENIKVESKEPVTQKTESQPKEKFHSSNRTETSGAQPKESKTEVKSPDSIFTLSRQMAVPIKKGERPGQTRRTTQGRSQERSALQENFSTLNAQSKQSSSKDSFDYLKDQDKRDQEGKQQDQQEDEQDESQNPHLERDDQTGTFKVRSDTNPEPKKVREIEKSPWAVQASTSKPPTKQDKQAEGMDNIYIRFMALMARILGQAEAAAQDLYQRIKGRTDDVDTLTRLISKINSEKGDIDWSKDEEMKELIEKCREIGVDIPEGKYQWKEDEKKLLKENIQMRKDSMEKMTQLERTDMQRYMQEASHCHQARSNILKQIKEIGDTIIRNFRPG